LLLAAKGAYPDMMELLLEHGADLNARTVEETTALMLAAGVAIFNEGDDAGTEVETLRAVKLLVGRGAAVNEVDANGETAMHGAAYRGHNSVVQYLDGSHCASETRRQEQDRMDAVDHRRWRAVCRVSEGAPRHGRVAPPVVDGAGAAS
jgi:hypothetical protein